jgi:acetyltransferase-like isoleucine patch superfamily enzyme
MYKVLQKLRNLLSSGDVKFFFYEKYSLQVGNISVRLNKIIYGRRLNIQPPFKVWGNIRFLFLGEGSISIGKNFHAVSSRRRSAITLFSPCHLNIIGNGQIILGEHVGLNGNTITARSKIYIGDNTMIGPNTIIIDHDGHQAWPPDARWTQSGLAQEIVIENDVWIGMNCIILKGVRIESGSIIAGGSIVIHDVEANSLYAGNPARKIKSLGNESRI